MASSLTDQSHHLSSSWFVGMVLESALYAAYLVCFAISMYFLFNVRGQRVSPNPIFLIISSLLFATITTHWVLTVDRAYDCFINEGTQPFGALLCFTDLNAKEIARLVLYAIGLMLMDTLLAYRLWIIWGRNTLITLLPAAAVLAYLGGTIAQIYLASHATFNEVIFGGTVGNLVAANYTLSLVVCVYTTGLIIFRILQNGRVLKEAGIGNVLNPVLHIVIESAAVYSALTLFVLVAYVLNKTVLFVALSIIPPTVGINYCLIIIRVGLGTAQGSRTGPTPPAFEQFSMSRVRDTTNGIAIANYPLKVNVTQHIEDDADLEMASSVDKSKRGPLTQ